MRLTLTCATILLLIASGCNRDGNAEQRHDALSDRELLDLEIRSQRNDIVAIRRLENFYLSNSNVGKAALLHQKLVDLNEPQALYREAMRLALQAKKAKGADNRLQMLLKARDFAQRGAKFDGGKDPSLEITNQYINRELKELKTS